MNVWSTVERCAAYMQGKGYGSSTVRREVSAAISLLGRQPRLVVDIGGNKGAYTAEVLKRTPDAKVHIFEPSSVNVRHLADRFSGDPRVSICNAALGKERGEAQLFSDVEGSGLASLTKRRLDHFDIEMGLSESISVVKFSDYWADQLNSSIIDLTKIDVEGHELDVLSGFDRALAHVKLIQFEFGGCNIDSRTYYQDFWYFFKDIGFKLHRIAPFKTYPIDTYTEMDELFITTNYIAINGSMFKA